MDISSVNAHSLEWHENPGHLSKQNIDESQIAPENRIPRVTSATWKYESGAVGTFTHVVALQGHDYSCELEVYADGYQFKFVLLPLRAIPWTFDTYVRATDLSTHTYSQCSISGARART